MLLMKFSGTFNDISCKRCKLLDGSNSFYVKLQLCLLLVGYRYVVPSDSICVTKELLSDYFSIHIELQYYSGTW